MNEKVDEFHGIGGAYIVEDGVRRRVEDPTVDHPEGNCARDKNGKPIAPPEPAKEKKPAAAAPAEGAATSASTAKKGGGK